MSDTPCPICYPDGIKEPAAQQDARENVTSTSAPAVSAAPTSEESSLRRVAAKAITPGTGDELESKRLKRELAAAKEREQQYKISMMVDRDELAAAKADAELVKMTRNKK